MKASEQIPEQDLEYLKSRGFEGSTMEEAFDWTYIKHGLFCNSRLGESDLDCLKQLIQILKIRNVK